MFFNGEYKYLVRQTCEESRQVLFYHPSLSPSQEFAGEGLRTLVLAYKDLDKVYFADWQKRHHEASTSLEDREEKLAVLYEEIEKDLKVCVLMHRQLSNFLHLNPDCFVWLHYFETLVQK